MEFLNETLQAVSAGASIFQTIDFYNNGSKDANITLQKVRNVFRNNQEVITSSIPDGYQNYFNESNIIIEDTVYLTDSNFFEF